MWVRGDNLLFCRGLWRGSKGLKNMNIDKLTPFIECKFATPQLHIISLPTPFKHTRPLPGTKSEVLLDQGPSLVNHVLILLDLGRLKRGV